MIVVLSLLPFEELLANEGPRAYNVIKAEAKSPNRYRVN
jgi:hypothetical protein